MKIDTGPSFLYRGEWGSRVTITFEAQDGGDGVYDLVTRGKAPDDVLAEIEALRASHRAKMVRHADLEPLRGKTLVGGWTLQDAYVERRGTEAHLCIITVSPGGEVVEHEWFAPSADQLPDNAEAVLEVLKKLGKHTEQKVAHDAGLAAALGKIVV